MMRTRRWKQKCIGEVRGKGSDDGRGEIEEKRKERKMNEEGTEQERRKKEVKRGNEREKNVKETEKAAALEREERRKKKGGNEEGEDKTTITEMEAERI